MMQCCGPSQSALTPLLPTPRPGAEPAAFERAEDAPHEGKVGPADDRKRGGIVVSTACRIPGINR
jgi:hypothetical protein